jgi:hypothetical protein
MAKVNTSVIEQLAFPVDQVTYRHSSVSEFKSDTSGFHSERELVDYIELNIGVFCETVARVDYGSHKREWYLSPLKPFSGNKPKIDLMVLSSSGRRIGIECKYPKHGTFADLSRSVSQMLSYAVIARDNRVPFDDLYLLTTEYDPIVDSVIQAYELPIHVVVFCKEMRAEWCSPYASRI